MRRAALGAVLAAALCAGALAQQSEVEATAALRCLTVVPGGKELPEYPYTAFRFEREGKVAVRLTFEHPDRPPSVAWLDVKGHHEEISEFRAAVSEHVRDLRVPCLREGEGPSRLDREYVFVPDRRDVYFARGDDPDFARRRELLKCAVHIVGTSRPEYPMRARQEGIQGRVLVRLRFDSPDRPPQVETFARPYARLLAQASAAWYEGMRLPCHDGQPLIAIYTHVFVFEDSRGYGFKPMVLQQLMAMTKGIRHRRLAMDTTAMNCPFDVRIELRQPHMPNRVVQVGDFERSRQPLIDWLRGVELDVSPKHLDAAFANEMLVTVPCLKIDLKPKE